MMTIKQIEVKVGGIVNGYVNDDERGVRGDERHLDLRAFPEDVKYAVWERQHHKCALCHKEFDYEGMEGDHITPWREGGRTVVENCQMLCRECNRRKGGK